MNNTQIIRPSFIGYLNIKPMFLSKDWKVIVDSNEEGFQINVSGSAKSGMLSIKPELFKIYPPGFDREVLQLNIINIVNNEHGILHEVHYSELIEVRDYYKSVNVFHAGELLLQIKVFY